MNNKATLPYARIPRELLWSDVLTPVAIKILAWVQTLRDGEKSFKNGTEGKLMKLWPDVPKAQIVEAIQILEKTGLLSRKGFKFGHTGWGKAYRFATYAEIEDFCKHLRRAASGKTTDESKAAEN